MTHLHYHDLVTPSLTIDRAILGRMALRRARREQADRRRHGYPARSFGQIFASELLRLVEIAQSTRDGRIAQREFNALPIEDRVIASTELELFKAKNGLAMPLDRKLTARIERDLAAAHARRGEFQTAAVE